MSSLVVAPSLVVEEKVPPVQKEQKDVNSILANEVTRKNSIHTITKSDDEKKYEQMVLSDESDEEVDDDWGDPIQVDPALFQDHKKLIEFLKSIEDSNIQTNK